MISLAFVVAVVGLVIIPEAVGLREEVVLSGGMEPALPKGGLLLVEPLGGLPQPGEIITFRRPDDDHSEVSRRVLLITDHLGGPTIWTKADAGAAPDPWALRPDQVAGRVRYTIPYVGTPVRWLHTPLGLMLAVGFPLGFILLHLLNLQSNKRREQDRTRTLVESRLRSAYRS